ncbi:MAG: hypothetical protein QXX94_00900 [Candidatus Bathyarchaeia archaeon]
MSRRHQAIVCPKCSFEFNILYARTVSCQSCSRMLSSLSCEYVKCPSCGFEFQISESSAKISRRWSEKRFFSIF